MSTDSLAGYQGRFPLDPKAAQRLHVPQEMVDVMTISQQLKVGRQKEQTKGLKGGEEIANPSVQVLNMLMGAIKNADTVLTVSPGYAREVTRLPAPAPQTTARRDSVSALSHNRARADSAVERRL